MSRSGYTDEMDDTWRFVCWRGAVASAIRGKRGQAFLRELLEALDGMPEKRLIPNALEAEGAFCTLGAIGAKRGIDLSQVDTENHKQLSIVFGISSALAQEIMWENDEGEWRETPEQRWTRVRQWVVDRIQPSGADSQGGE